MILLLVETARTRSGLGYELELLQPSKLIAPASSAGACTRRREPFPSAIVAHCQVECLAGRRTQTTAHARLRNVIEGLAAVGALVGVLQVVLEDVGEVVGPVLVDQQIAIEDYGAEFPARRQGEL